MPTLIAPDQETFEVKASLKSLIPEATMPIRILSGPFRGAIIEASPRNSLRKLFGIYEHELNGWLKKVIPRVSTVLDLGANEGYFSFGCAAAFRRLGIPGEIIAFEPIEQLFEGLKRGALRQQDNRVRFSLHNLLVGSVITAETTTLDEISRQRGPQQSPNNALIKIDVEGAEVDVISAATSWLNPTNYFLIEVHEEPFLAILTKTFSDYGLKLNRIEQRPLPVIGYETRSRLNWWLVSDLSH